LNAGSGNIGVGAGLLGLGNVLAPIGIPLWVNGAKTPTAADGARLFPTIAPGTQSVTLRWAL
jgi:hypothetical protein